jgi:hypothetical protein
VVGRRGHPTIVGWWYGTASNARDLSRGHQKNVAARIAFIDQKPLPLRALYLSPQRPSHVNVVRLEQCPDILGTLLCTSSSSCRLQNEQSGLRSQSLSILGTNF